MAKIPDSTKPSLEWKLRARAKQRWPALEPVTVKHRAGLAYVTGHLPDGEALPLCRLRYGRSASRWGFAIYRASHDDYHDNFLPTGLGFGSPEDALDPACGLYLGDPTAWITPPTNSRAGPLAPPGTVRGRHRSAPAARWRTTTPPTSRQGERAVDGAR